MVFSIISGASAVYNLLHLPFQTRLAGEGEEARLRPMLAGCKAARTAGISLILKHHPHGITFASLLAAIQDMGAVRSAIGHAPPAHVSLGQLVG